MLVFSLKTCSFSGSLARSTLLRLFSGENLGKHLLTIADTAT
jgi:hypothetical protein